MQEKPAQAGLVMLEAPAIFTRGPQNMTRVNLHRRLTALALLLLPVFANAQTTHDVTVGNNFFSPANLTIQVGDTVRWNNPADGGPVHNVTGGGFSSPTAESFTYSRTFTAEAFIDYLCTIHPSMQGSITVGGGGNGGDPADLTLSEVTVASGTYEPGDQISVGAQVDNIGGEDSSAYSVDFYASTNQSITGVDTFLGSTNRPAVGAGDSDNFNVNVNLPFNIAENDYYIGGIIDINDASNGNNSEASANTITVAVESAGFPLNAGHNGNWYNAAERNGEGAQFELSDDGAGGLIFVATMYSYGPNGGQIFLIAVGPVVDGVAMVDVFITTGAMWGDDFDPADVMETQWGTGVFSASSCDEVHMSLVPNAEYAAQGYTALEYSMGRLVSPVLPCPAP